MAMIDLRSDTVTRPTAEMRKAMADAEVGDDVYGDDPTVRKLEERVAQLFGTEAALFVPSGTMANQIALRAHTQPGEEVIIGKDAHCWRHESGALAALAGLQTYMMPDATFTAADVRAAYKGGDDVHLALTRVVAIENTHNLSGGTCWNRAQLTEVIDAAHGLGLAVHLDGARIWNAAVAGETTERELVQGFDSISACLSKGLGAPIGSLIAGRRDFIQRCRKFRKMYGGGMRQAGILAAAGLYALDHHRARLRDDHANARVLAERLAGAKHVRVDPSRVQTNIVMIDLERGTPAAVVEQARKAGVLLGALGPHRIRAVTHLDVDRAGVQRAGEVIAEIVASL
ncbi:MAG TPA: low-specificity L-threonine aldolase [Kofleriaceae bacterium]|jgi:threonine aldolase|nr:low-specificity L-threonine aldolase [Kofleriaceae bacterium]